MLRGGQSAEDEAAVADLVPVEVGPQEAALREVVPRVGQCLAVDLGGEPLAFVRGKPVVKPVVADPEREAGRRVIQIMGVGPRQIRQRV